MSTPLQYLYDIKNPPDDINPETASSMATFLNQLFKNVISNPYSSDYMKKIRNVYKAF